MAWFVLLVSYLAVALCLAILALPKILRKMIDFLSIGKRLYAAGLLRIIFGVMLLFLASESRLWGYVVVNGLMAASTGTYLFFLALKRSKKLFSRLNNQSDLRLRLFVLIGLALWGLLVYALLPAVSASAVR